MENDSDNVNGIRKVKKLIAHYNIVERKQQLLNYDYNENQKD